MFSYEFCKSFKNTIFYRTPPVAASFLPWTGKVFEFFKWNARNQCIGWENYVYIIALSKDWVLFRSSHRKVFCEKGVLTNFAKFTRKHLCESLFLIKLLADTDNFIKKETLAQVFFCEFYKIFKNTFSCRTPPVAASNFYNNSGPFINKEKFSIKYISLKEDDK